MSYFDKANTEVTRKSFGSKVDKTFQREGVIPVKERKKDVRDYAAESAKYKELNDKVNKTRLEELKNSKAYEIKLQEGYKALKDELIKDFIAGICIESLLVDTEVVNENLKNIVSIINEQVDNIGGFEGFKSIAENTQNPILMNMVKICESTCKKVGERNLRESNCDANGVDFRLSKIDMDEFDHKKKAMGAETIVNHIKDKVFQVVQDEQKINAERQEVMSEIETKIQELEAPMEEAMTFIFESTGVEESTLFNSLMVSQYKQLLESNSSAIFESFDYLSEEKEEDFEDHEFAMSEIEIDDDGDFDLDDIKDQFMEECFNLIKNSFDMESLEDVTNEVYEKINESAQDIKTKKAARLYKQKIRNLQESIEVLEEGIHKKSRKYSDKKLDKKIDKCEKDIAKVKGLMVQHKDDPDWMSDLKEDLGILKAELKVLQNERKHRANQKKIKTNPYEKAEESRLISASDMRALIEARLVETKDVAANGDLSKDEMKEPKGKKVEEGCGGKSKCKEDLIVCPDCGKAECTCKAVKESDIVIEEGVVVNKIAKYFDDKMLKKIAGRDFDKVRVDLVAMVKKCSTIEEIEILRNDFTMGVGQLERAKAKHPDEREKIDNHIKWLKTDGKKMLDDQMKYIKKQKVTESFMDKLDDICESLANVIESHEVAYNNVLESLNFEINGNDVLVPFLQTKDVNLSNLEFAYKTKIVCESLRDGIKTAKYDNDVNVLNRAVELNINSIEETMDVIKDNEQMKYKSRILNAGKTYLNKVKSVLESMNLEVTIEESTAVFGSTEDVDKIFSSVREYYEIESTDSQLMEMVMAEAIVKYTIMETFNTLNIIKYDKDKVRQIARKNISK